jgi:uncharacterized protein
MRGEVAFPLQLIFFRSEPETDYTGGDFLLQEQRPRVQSMRHAIHARRGKAVVFITPLPANEGTRGFIAPIQDGERRRLQIQAIAGW